MGSSVYDNLSDGNLLLHFVLRFKNLWPGPGEPLFANYSVARHPFNSLSFPFPPPPYLSFYLVITISLCCLAISSLTSFSLLLSWSRCLPLAFLRAGIWLLRHRVEDIVARNTGKLALHKAKTVKQDTDSIVFVFSP